MIGGQNPGNGAAAGGGAVSGASPIGVGPHIDTKNPAMVGRVLPRNSFRQMTVMTLGPSIPTKVPALPVLGNHVIDVYPLPANGANMQIALGPNEAVYGPCNSLPQTAQVPITMYVKNFGDIWIYSTFGGGVLLVERER